MWPSAAKDKVNICFTDNTCVKKLGVLKCPLLKNHISWSSTRSFPADCAPIPHITLEKLIWRNPEWFISQILTEGVLVFGATHCAIWEDLQVEVGPFIGRVEMTKPDLPIKLVQRVGIWHWGGHSPGDQHSPEKQVNRKQEITVALEKNWNGQHCSRMADPGKMSFWDGKDSLALRRNSRRNSRFEVLAYFCQSLDSIVLREDYREFCIPALIGLTQELCPEFTKKCSPELLKVVILGMRSGESSKLPVTQSMGIVRIRRVSSFLLWLVPGLLQISKLTNIYTHTLYNRGKRPSPWLLPGLQLSAHFHFPTHSLGSPRVSHGVPLAPTAPNMGSRGCQSLNIIILQLLSSYRQERMM